MNNEEIDSKSVPVNSGVVDETNSALPNLNSTVPMGRQEMSVNMQMDSSKVESPIDANINSGSTEIAPSDSTIPKVEIVNPFLTAQQTPNTNNQVVSSLSPEPQAVVEVISEPVNPTPQVATNVAQPIEETALANNVSSITEPQTVAEVISEPVNSTPQVATNVAQPIEETAPANNVSSITEPQTVVEVISEPVNSFSPKVTNVTQSSAQGPLLESVASPVMSNQLNTPISNGASSFVQPMNSQQPIFNPFQNNSSGMPSADSPIIPNQNNNIMLNSNASNSFVPTNNFTSVNQNNSIVNNSDPQQEMTTIDEKLANNNKHDTSIITQIVYTIVGIALIVGVGFGVAYFVNKEPKIVCLRSTGSKFVVKFDENGIKSATLNGKEVPENDLATYQTIFSKDFLDAKRQEEDYIESFKRIVKQHEESSGGSCE